MIKKILISSLLVACGTVNASQMLCGYKDHFELSPSTNGNVYIYSFYSDADLFVEKIGPRSFNIEDGGQCRKGHATVVFTHTQWGSCSLDITEGPYMSHPRINAGCNGYMQYEGYYYEGSNSYTLYFSGPRVK